MNTPVFLDRDWVRVLNMLPVEFDDNPFVKLAIQRRRSIQTPSELLRLCLAYGVCDLSLRQTAAWASAIGLGEMSDVAVLKRLRNCADWLGFIVAQWLRERGLTSVKTQHSIRLIDATLVRSPGLTAPDFRLHLGLQLNPLQIKAAELTQLDAGEQLQRHILEPGEIAIADRVYATAAGIASVLRQGAHVVVRMYWRNLPLYSQRGSRLDVLSLLTTLEEHEVGDWPVNVRYDDQEFELRLIAIKKTSEATLHEQKRLKRKSQKSGSKLDAKSLLSANYMYMVTDLPRDEFPAREILELYRVRWQIELAFKRMKSLLNMADLRAKDPQLARTYLFSKLLGCLILEAFSSGVDFFPWGFPLCRPTLESLAAARPAGTIFAQRDQGDDWD